MRNRDGDFLELYLIRHGETAWNKEGRYLGDTDLPLTEEGKKALLQKKAPPADVVFVSPMLRAMQTAKILYTATEPVIVEAFKEMKFGEFEGKNYQELNGNADYQAYIDSGGEVAFPGGESKEEFVMRTMTGFTQVLMEAAATGKKPVRIAIVAHGGTVMAIASSLLGGDYFSYRVKNGEYLHLTGCQKEKRKITWNIIS